MVHCLTRSIEITAHRKSTSLWKRCGSANRTARRATRFLNNPCRSLFSLFFLLFFLVGHTPRIHLVFRAEPRYDLGMSLPPLFTCFVCNYAIDPNSSNSLRLASVWLKGAGKTVDSVENEMYRYRHNFCNLDPNFEQDSLF